MPTTSCRCIHRASAPAGSYNWIGAGPDEIISFVWPGGPGPHLLDDTYIGPGCSGDPGLEPATVVVADSAESAAAPCGESAIALNVDPAPPGDCRFYLCGR